MSVIYKNECVPALDIGKCFFFLPKKTFSFLFMKKRKEEQDDAGINTSIESKVDMRMFVAAIRHEDMILKNTIKSPIMNNNMSLSARW
jgi:hypothetical protein